MQPAGINERFSNRIRILVVRTGILAVLITSISVAQTPAPASARPMNVVATSTGVNGAGETIDFYINRWSTDADRDKVAAAWNVTAAPPPLAPTPAAGVVPAAAPAEGGGGRGGGGRSAAAPAADATTGAAPAADAGAAAGAAAGRGGGGRGGGRGGGGGGGGAAAAPKTPESSLAGTMKDLPSLGYFWTSEVGGYVIRYAYRTSLPDGGNRIILLTDKRLGTAKNNWQLAEPLKPNSYEFTLIELRLPAKGMGEGKASLTGSLEVDPNTKSIALAGYETLPVVMKGAKLQ
jgi:hypothetical protein